MALNGKYTTVQEIIEGVYINAGYQTIDWAEALVHIGRALSLLGIPDIYVDKLTDDSNGNLPPIEIEDYRGDLPRDLVYIIGCRDYDTKQVLTYNTNSFHLNPSNENDYIPFVEDTDYSTFNSLTQEQLTTDPQLRKYFYNYKNTHVLETNWLLNDKSVNDLLNDGLIPTYKVNNNYIFTNFETGQIEMSYKAWATDSDGLPLIPEDEKVKRALESYLIERIDYKKWRRGELRVDVYMMSKQDRAFAMASARSKAGIPSQDQMEAIKNMWNRLIPDIRAHADGFKTMNIDERRKISRRRIVW